MISFRDTNDLANLGICKYDQIQLSWLLQIYLKGQLQRFHKLSLFDRFRHVENGLDINF